MLKKIKLKLKESKFFVFRLLVICSAILAFGAFSIGYAYFNQTLSGRGTVNIAISEAEIIITNVSSPTIHKNATIVRTATHSQNNITFSVELDQTNATVTYDITIKNNGSSNVRFDNTEEVSNNDAVIYKLSGIDESTILAPQEELTFHLIICYSEEYKYNFPDSKKDTTTLSFIFHSTLRNPIIPIEGYIVEDSGDVSASRWGAPATIVLDNKNDFDVEVKLSTIRSFTIYDDKGVERNFHIEANSSIERKIYIKDNDKAISSGTVTDVYVQASVTDYDTVKTVFIDSININLGAKGKYQVLEDGFSELNDEEDFSEADTGKGGIYSTVGAGGESTYFYRGAVSDNYFSFAGYTWRILRLDENANIRLILNDVLKDSKGNALTNKFKESNTAQSIEEAETLVKFVNDLHDPSVNSPIYGSIDDTSDNTLRGWYNNTIAGTVNESYVVESTFCMDTEGGTATSSGTSSAVYYFGAYQKVGPDTDMYEPSFDCSESGKITGYVGLLSADEYVFAGGAFRKSNTSFFLNDSGISTTWWTLSPAYYDPTLKTVGVFAAYADGSITDWPDGNTIKNSFGIRPVITVRGTDILNGSGTKTDPYRFAALDT